MFFCCILLLSLDRYVRWGVTIHDEIGKVAINSILSIHGIRVNPRFSKQHFDGIRKVSHHDFAIDDPRTRIWHPKGLRRLHLFVFTAMIDVPAFFSRFMNVYGIY